VAEPCARVQHGSGLHRTTQHAAESALDELDCQSENAAIAETTRTDNRLCECLDRLTKAITDAASRRDGMVDLLQDSQRVPIALPPERDGSRLNPAQGDQRLQKDRWAHEPTMGGSRGRPPASPPRPTLDQAIRGRLEAKAKTAEEELREQAETEFSRRQSEARAASVGGVDERIRNAAAGLLQVLDSPAVSALDKLKNNKWVDSLKADVGRKRSDWLKLCGKAPATGLAMPPVTFDAPDIQAEFRTFCESNGRVDGFEIHLKELMAERSEKAMEAFRDGAQKYLAEVFPPLPPQDFIDAIARPACEVLEQIEDVRKHASDLPWVGQYSESVADAMVGAADLEEIVVKVGQSYEGGELSAVGSTPGSKGTVVRIDSVGYRLKRPPREVIRPAKVVVGA